MDYPLLPKTAKHLWHKNDWYRCIEDANGDEWLVEAVLDKGRCLRLYKPNTDGEVKRVLWSHTFKDYKIVAESLSEEQQAAIENALKN